MGIASDTLIIMTNARTKTGQIPRKRGDTLVRTIEQKYRVDLGYRSDTKLSTALKKSGAPSLSKLIQMVDKTRQKSR